ncbi:hypothetical protein D3C86_1480600 [compost metagenome]
MLVVHGGELQEVVRHVLDVTFTSRLWYPALRQIFGRNVHLLHGLDVPVFLKEFGSLLDLGLRSWPFGAAIVDAVGLLAPKGNDTLVINTLKDVQ